MSQVTDRVLAEFSTRQRNYNVISWNRLILLYGPSGTGKTTLCRALAQQLSIRLGKRLPSCKLVEIDAHSLFSKYFSESGKAVSKLFGTIESMLDEEENTFVCIFIDEIESLASTREHSMKSNEPQDTLRVSLWPIVYIRMTRRLTFPERLSTLCSSLSTAFVLDLMW